MYAFSIYATFRGPIRCVPGRFIGFGQVAFQRSGFGPLVHSVGRRALLRGQRGKPADNSCRCCFRMSGSESRLLTNFSYPWWARFMILLYLDCDIAFPSPTLAKVGDGAAHGA